MRSYHNWRLAALLGLIIFISGCTDIREANEVAVPLGTGCELAAINDQLELSVQFSVPAGSSGDQSSEAGFMVLTSTGRTLSEASRKLSSTLPLTPLYAHVGTFIIGENLARNDVGLLADFLIRNPYSRETQALFVSRKSSPDEIFNTVTPLEPFSATGLANMIEIQEQQIGIYQPVQASEFLNSMTTSGIEPVCPQVGIETNGDKEILKLVGTAVFKKNRMVGELNETESRAFRIMNPEGIEGGLLVVKWDAKTLITIEQLRMRSKNTANIDKEGRLKMRIELKGEGNFYEQSAPGEILTLSGIKKLETKTEQQIEQETRQCIKKVQLMGSDIFGWGLIFARKYPSAWQDMKSDWPHYFAQVEPEFDVSYKIRRTYLTDQSFIFRD